MSENRRGDFFDSHCMLSRVKMLLQCITFSFVEQSIGMGGNDAKMCTSM